MGIFIGNNEISTAFVGADEVQEIWVGGDQVWTNLPDISAGSYTLVKSGGLTQTLENPFQTSTYIRLYHNFVFSGSFYLNISRATKAVTLGAGSYRVHFTLANELSHPDGNRSQLKLNITGSGTTNKATTFTDGSTLSNGAKSVDFTQNSENTVQFQFESTMNTSGATSTNPDRRIDIQNIYLEKL